MNFNILRDFFCILGKVMLLVIFAEQKSKKKINERYMIIVDTCTLYITVQCTSFEY